MISTGDLRKGAAIEVDGRPYAVLDYDHIKMGRGSAQVRLKLRDVLAGNIIEHTVQAGTKFPRANVDRRQYEYLYNDGDFYYFMNPETFEQVPVDAATVGDKAKWLRENTTCELVLYQGNPIDVELPVTVELEITETDPGFKGDTAQGGSKPATLETGAQVQVPLFIERGTRIKVNTNTGEYVERAN